MHIKPPKRASPELPKAAEDSRFRTLAHRLFCNHSRLNYAHTC
jgi:hypothetical protein